MHSLPESVLIAVVSHKCAKQQVARPGCVSAMMEPVISGACAVWERVNWMWAGSLVFRTIFVVRVTDQLFHYTSPASVPLRDFTLFEADFHLDTLADILLHGDSTAGIALKYKLFTRWMTYCTLEAALSRFKLIHSSLEMEGLELSITGGLENDAL